MNSARKLGLNSASDAEMSSKPLEIARNIVIQGARKGSRLESNGWKSKTIPKRWNSTDKRAAHRWKNIGTHFNWA